eukprot:TRINITY_DN75448_c0_g1_i1.p1 TRINITY_DN75448_c0_g1~~TRINITY_DN75448_c0_g1_i1.p1  ORF type:complete len:354 (-),score=84.66 TRINITY_DN75448_c0_g1_i1:56-1057(-)
MVVFTIKKLTGEMVNFTGKANDTMDKVKAKLLEKGVYFETLNFEGKQVKDAQTLGEFIPIFTAGGYDAGSSGGYGGGGSGDDNPEDPDDPDSPDDPDENPDGQEDQDGEENIKIFVRKNFDDGETFQVEVQQEDPTYTLKAIIKIMTGIPRNQQVLIFEEQVMEDDKQLGFYGVDDGRTITLALGLAGGAPKKRKASKTAKNPFEDDETPVYPTAEDTGHFQSAFSQGINVGVMTRDNLDVKTILAVADVQTLDTVINHLEHGTAHHHVRLEDVAEMVPFVASMKRVSMLCDNAIEKFKKLMASKMWQLGLSHGVFKMDTLVAFVKGVKALKQ